MNVFVTLVCGLPGTGKTTYVKRRIENALVCDLDAIAAAFRLTNPHEEYNDNAQRMANDYLNDFIDCARNYTNEVYIIRTAPDIAELRQINPDRVVICLTQHVKRPSREYAIYRLADIVEWCKQNSVSLEYA